MKPMTFAVSGASGLIGSTLIGVLKSKGHAVRRLVRSKRDRAKDDIYWNFKSGEIDGRMFDGVDAVVHLAGENIAERRWTRRQKERIRESRLAGTRLIAQTIARLGRKPKVFLCASAIGFYGDSEQPVDESSAPGEGYLSELCASWEAASGPARNAGIRTVNLRFGVVLSKTGGALAKMLPPFRLGAGGPIGSGAQPMSWVSIDDVVGAMLFVIENERIDGPVNITAPGVVSNREFAKSLGKALGRPAILPLPGFMVRFFFGEMGESLLLGGAPVVPKRLQDAGFKFRHAQLDSALADLLSR